MRQTLQRIGLLTAMLLMAINTFADFFKVDGIYYNILDREAKTVEVTCDPFEDWSNPYSGEVDLPQSVIFKDVSYTVISIGERAFYGCTGLTSISIPNTVISIKRNAFSYCAHLTSVTIPNSVTSIGTSAFKDCDRLTSVTIGTGVSSIEYGAFDFCDALTKVEISDLSAWCKIEFGDFFSNPLICAHHLYHNGEEITNLVIPDDVTEIKNNSFRGGSFTSVRIPESVTSLGKYSFYECIDLSSVFIPSSITSIDRSVFDECLALTKVEISDLSAWCKIYFDEWDSNPLRYAGHLYMNGEEIINLVIPEDITEIKKNTFNGGVGFTSVKIPDCVISIGEGAFYNCNGLNSVTIPNSVTSIGKNAFYGCIGLTSVSIGNSVTSIGESAFESCGKLTSISIGNSVSSIDDLAFFECTSLTSVTIPDSVTSIGFSAFCGCIGLTSVSIGNGVISIEDNAFSQCRGLTTISIGNSVTSIGNEAFNECSSLTKVEISDLAAWCNIDFENSWSNPFSYADHLYLNGEEIKDLVIPCGVKEIKELAFYGCNGLTSLKISDTVTSIGRCAFTRCGKLTSVTIGNSVNSIQEIAFSRCPELKTINSFAVAPPEIFLGTFPDFSADLHIPKGTKKEYQTISYWHYFNNMTDDLDSSDGVEKIDSDVSGETVEIYDMRGVKVGVSTEELVPGIYIMKQGGKVKKIAIQ